MISNAERSHLRRAQRLRARATWAFVVAAIGLAGTLVGLVQFVLRGAVSIRPGHDPTQGSEALTLLAGMFLVSLGFAAAGMFLRHRARRGDSLTGG